ncbi:axonemal dynein light intermediate polypeptide 1 [Cyclopterus lumpus]|uniref:axonemal dynein light intermediate polypeptide 1 n=1 Tax=Cyclopterus lumpus TaxID=8103 RepID=UPI001486154C|nr:axonemal dynein light intermediate polypeptide 1 [Cyclopterus lumpus]
MTTQTNDIDICVTETHIQFCYSSKEPTMSTANDSLLKYDHPISVSKSTDRKSSKGRSLRVNPQQPANSNPVPPPPKPKSATADASLQENQEILNCLLPPREWMEGNQLWVQQVSSAPSTRSDVIGLEELLDKKLQQKQARQTGICQVRRELYSQCFDELIRQVTINCAERGLLMCRIRDEIQMTIAVYQTLYESSMAFGMRKALWAEQGKTDMEKSISDLEKEKQDLKQH